MSAITFYKNKHAIAQIANRAGTNKADREFYIDCITTDKKYNLNSAGLSVDKNLPGELNIFTLIFIIEQLLRCTAAYLHPETKRFCHATIHKLLAIPQHQGARHFVEKAIAPTTLVDANSLLNSTPKLSVDALWDIATATGSLATRASSLEEFQSQYNFCDIIFEYKTKIAKLIDTNTLHDAHTVMCFKHTPVLRALIQTTPEEQTVN